MAMNVRRVADRVRARRQARGWSQRELDRRAGLSHGYVSKLEAGQIPKFSMAQLRKIAEALGTRVEDLIEGVWDRAEEEAEESEEEAAAGKEVEGIRMHLLALKELDPDALAHVREIVAAMRENAERRYKEDMRAQRRRRKAAQQAGQVDQEIQSTLNGGPADTGEPGPGA